MILTDTTWIGAAPERIFRFFQAMDENYTRWHPDHPAFQWIDGDGLVEEGRFRMSPEDDGCRLDAEIRVRTGPVGAWLNRREFEAVRRHMMEEGENLKRILEMEAKP